MPFHSPALSTRSYLSADQSQVTFKAYDVALSNGDCLQLWSNLHKGASWDSTDFVSHHSGVFLASVQVPRDDIGARSEFEFTHRIRHADGAFTWLGQQGGNGRIVIASLQSSPTLDHDQAFQKYAEKDNVTLYKYSLPSGNTGDINVTRLGRAASEISATIAIQHAPDASWYHSNVRQGFQMDINNHTQLLLLRDSASHVTVLFPFSTAQVSCTLMGTSGSQEILLRTERDSEEEAVALVVAATGHESKLHNLIQNCVTAARRILNPQLDGNVQPATFKQNALRFCTWNALGEDGGYTLEPVLAHLESFKNAKMDHMVDSILLDDGWEDVTRGTTGGNGRAMLNSFAAFNGWASDFGNESGETESLKRATIIRKDSGYEGSPRASEVDADIIDMNAEELAIGIKQIKRSGSIKTVGIWITLEGYWGGINPDESHSDLARRYKLQRWNIDNHASHSKFGDNEKYIYLPAEEELERFWNECFATLAQAGVDYVKVDNQTMVDWLVSDPSQDLDAAQWRTRNREAMYAKYRKYFPEEGIIHCMAHNARVYASTHLGLAIPPRHIPAIEAKPFLRTSDDFFPRIEDSHRWHILANTTNALLHSHLSFTPDFDMFVTAHPYQKYHALLRVLSPSPVYVSDYKDRHDTSFLSCLGGLNAAKKWTVSQSRCLSTNRLAGSVFEDVTSAGDGPALKASCGFTHGSVLAVWNARGSGGKVRDMLTHRDIADALPTSSGQDTALFSFNRQTATLLGCFDGEQERAIDRISSHPLVPLQLDEPNACDSITIAVMRDVHGLPIAVLGLVDKLGSLAAVHSIKNYCISPAKQQVLPIKPLQTVLSVPAPLASSTVTSRRQSHILLFLRSLGTPRPGNQARTSFLHDLVRAPLRTLFTEVRAAFGLFFLSIFYCTSPVRVARKALDSTEDEQRPLLTAEAYRPNGTAKIQEVEQEIEQGEKKGLQVDLTISGKLGLLLGGPKQEFKVAIDGHAVPAQDIAYQSQHDGKSTLVTIDMDPTVTNISSEKVDSSKECWVVTVELP